MINVVLLMMETTNLGGDLPGVSAKTKKHYAGYVRPLIKQHGMSV